MDNFDGLLNDLEKIYPTGQNRLENELRSLKRKLDVTDNEGCDKRKKLFECTLCTKSFSRKDTLRNHVNYRCKERNKVYPCPHCKQRFVNYTGLFDHVKIDHPLNQVGAGNGKTNKKPVKRRKHNMSAMKGLANKHYIFPHKNERYDLLTFFANIKSDIVSHLRKRCKKKGSLKWYLIVHVVMTRQKVDGTSETADPHFRSPTTHILAPEDSKHVDHGINNAFQKMFKSFDEFIRKGSNWTLKKVDSLELHTASYKAIGGKAYFPLPRSIAVSKAVINVQNKKDEKCFLYAVLASLHPAKHHMERVRQYKKYCHEIDMSGINYPVHPSSMSKFERQNEISVNVLGFENGELFPIYLTKLRKARHEVDLLYLTRGNESHWCLIRNLNRLLYRTKRNTHAYHYCRYCLQGFTSNRVLKKHIEYCSIHGAQHTTLPTKGKDDFLKFTDYAKKLPVPFAIYADFESLVEKATDESPSTSTSETSKCIPCGYGYKVVCVADPKYSKRTTIYRGEDVSRRFIEDLLREEMYIKNVLGDIKPLNMSEQDENCFSTSTHCHICEHKFEEGVSIKVRDHCHITGKFRGASCQSCNLNFKYPSFIPVFCHGFSNFDSHIVCQGLGFFKREKIKCIAKSDEKYTSVTLGNLRFLDSYQFLCASLEDLTDNLVSDGGLNNFKSLQSEFQKAELLLRKGVYPYNYMDSFSRFNEKQLPKKKEFYNELTQTDISDDDYEYALKIWEEFEIETMGEYHDLYLKTDVLLLADIFENFRQTCLQYYKLDPAHFYTIPGLAWQAALRMSGVELELMTDPNMYLFFENSIRGGLSMISNRYAKANNPYLNEDYDSKKPHSYIIYKDCTNLYGKAMTMKLPHRQFEWLSDNQVESFDVQSISDDSETGYVLEVDLCYPKTLHNSHSDYPLAPEKMEITNEMLSPHTKELLMNLQPARTSKNQKELDRTPSTKLTATLYDKKRYILHYQNLKTYLRLGMKLKKIHKIVSFKQTTWLKTYIEFNTEKRKKTDSKFLKSFFKLLNNAVFGKTLENIRLHQNFKLVNTREMFKKEVAKSSFRHFTIFNEDLVGLSHAKTHLFLNKPIACGMTILELSKVVMYSFYYDHVKSVYGDNVKLLATDTDSLILHIKTDDVYKDMKHRSHLYDFSNYPPRHPLYNNDNKGVIGTFKDETESAPISEFVGLRSKMYAYVCPAKENPEHKVAKGVKKSAIANNLIFENYKQSLFDGHQLYCDMNMIKSQKHELFVSKINKRALCPADDKRWTLSDGVTTKAYGHYSTQKKLNSTEK